MYSEQKTSPFGSNLEKFGSNRPRQLKNKGRGFFPSSLKSSNEPKLSLVVVKWTQMPMIASKWEPAVYLAMQSYPQQEYYHQVVLKACQSNVKSYSVFNDPSTGILSPQIK
jgi:hypothetical protein